MEDFTIIGLTKEDEEMVAKHGYGSVYFNKNRGCYQAAFYVNEDGQKKRKILSAPTYEDAMLKMATFRAGGMAFVGENEGVAPVAPFAPVVHVSYHKIKDIWADFLKTKRGLKTTTYRWYEDMGRTIMRELGEKNIEELRTADINNFLLDCQHCKDGKLASDKRVKGFNKLIKAIIQFAINEDYISKNPYNGNVAVPKGYERDQRKNVYTIDEVKKILDELYYSDSLVLKSIVPMLLMSGLRINEMLALQYSDLDRENNTINVHQAVVPRDRNMGTVKSLASNRVVPVPPIFFDIVENWRVYRSRAGFIKRAVRKGNGDIIFANSRGELRNDNTVRKDCRDFLEGIGLRRKGTIFHGLRRTYATFLNRAGVEDQVVAKLLGHEDADKETSGAVARQHYILPDDEKMELKKQEAVKKFMDYVGDLFDKNIDLEFIKSA